MSPLTGLIFIAWVPLLKIADLEPSRRRFFAFAYLSVFIWNAATTWWIWNSTAAGAIGAIVANSFIMCVPLWGFHLFKYRWGHTTGLAAFVVFWLSFEYIHLNWQLSWPWLTLGNVFATHPNWVQWYEYTGTTGGSLWILLVNVLLLSCLDSFKITPRRWIGALAGAAVCLLAPVAWSYLLLNTTTMSTGSGANVVVVQPNIDPYNEKFTPGSTEQQIEKLIHLSEQHMDSNTQLVIWPETAVPVGVWQHEIQSDPHFAPIFAFANRHSGTTLLTGIEMYKFYGGEKSTITARKLNDDNYFDAFNAAVAISAHRPLQFYGKSRLVPGVETLPTFLMWLGSVFEHFGGTTGGYGKDEHATVFTTTQDNYIAAPIICYESIYGEYVAEYVQRGANLLCIITNDGWWANTPGHRQHLSYARLRAIETRKWVARSANTGISAIIDPLGNLKTTRGWDEMAAIKFSVPAVEGQTFFVRWGDWLSKVALVLMIVLVLWNRWFWFTKRNNIKSPIPTS